jgi:hypothetical protein
MHHLLACEYKLKDIYDQTKELCSDADRFSSWSNDSGWEDSYKRLVSIRDSVHCSYKEIQALHKNSEKRHAFGFW